MYLHLNFRADSHLHRQLNLIKAAMKADCPKGLLGQAAIFPLVILPLGTKHLAKIGNFYRCLQ